MLVHRDHESMDVEVEHFLAAAEVQENLDRYRQRGQPQRRQIINVVGAIQDVSAETQSINYTASDVRRTTVGAAQAAA